MSDTASPTDKDLLAAFLEGDAAAFEELYTRHARPVLAYLLAMLKDRTEAEEVLQHVFVSFLRQAPSLRKAAGIRAYLLTTARNRVINLHRDTARANSARQDYEVFARVKDGLPLAPSERLEAEEQRQRLNAALAELSDDEREVVMLHNHGGLTFTEMAKTLKLPRGTVATRYRTALNRLRGLMND